jgi:uncharacterized membrane protein
MKLQAAIVSAFIALTSWALAIAATQAKINNDSSMEKYVEVRSGNKNDCNANPVTTTTTIGARSFITVPYGGSVTHVCARYRLGNGWSQWHATGCPGSDNSLCYINL